MDDNKKIAVNTIILTIQQIIVLIITLYSSRVIINALGVVDFGIFNVVCGFVTIFAFLNTSMTNAVQRFFNYELGKNGIKGSNIIFNTSFVIQIILALIIVLLTETVGLWYINEKMVIPLERFDAAVWIYHFSIASLVFLVLQIPFSAAILAHEKMWYLAMVIFVDAVLKLLIALIIPYVSSDKLIFYGLFIALISFIDLILYSVYARLKFKEIRFNINIKKDFFKQMLSFTGWNLFGSFSSVFKDQGINVLINLFFGPQLNAARGIAFQVTSAIRSFSTTLISSTKPQLTQSYAQGNYERTFSLMFSSSKFAFLILLFLSLPAMFEVNYVLNLWLGDTIPEKTGLFIVLVMLANYFDVFSPPISFVVHATGQMKRYQVLTSIISLCIVPVSYISLCICDSCELVFVIAIIFTAIGIFVSLYILKSLLYFSLKKYFIQVFMPLCIVTCIPIPILMYIHFYIEEGFLRLLFTILCSSLLIICSAYILVLNKSERLLVTNYIKSKLL